MKQLVPVYTFCFCSLLASESAFSAIALDRTRIIVNGSDKSMSVSIKNDNKKLPYLAQAWLEDEKGNKISEPLMALPPVQRVEPGTSSQIKIQSTPAINKLPQDRESVYYFNVREIPPKSDKPNAMQIALQTRVKLFWRPKGIVVSNDDYANPWQKKVTLKYTGAAYEIVNPTPYHVTIVDAAASVKGNTIKGFSPMMVAPMSSAPLPGNKNELGSRPVLTYVNDFGGRPKLIFSCSGNSCQVAEHQDRE